MNGNRERLCFNCGVREANTLDHVISKTLIPEPRPNNLITVPACEECNRGFSRDEEYFRDRLSAAIGGDQFDAPATWDKAWKSMQHSKARGKKIGMFRDILKLPAPVKTKDGASDMGVIMNKQRVDRVVEKMVRGFYFHLFRQPLGDVEFIIDILSSVKQSEHREVLLTVLRKCSAAPTWAKRFGPDTSVICALDQEDNRAGLWAFKLLGQHIVVAMAGPSGYFREGEIRK